MPVTTTYPGVYIEELPSTSHSVTPAPTSVTVFVGYTNPFWQLADGSAPPFGQAVELFSFADYQYNFGGFFNSPWLPDYVGQAVFQFFLNGGSNAYVVALQAKAYYDDSTTPATNKGSVNAATAVLGTSSNGFTFTALQPVGLASPAAGLTMSITISNIVAPGNDVADLTIVYGTTVETYRRVPIANIATTVNARSRLAFVTTKGTLPTDYTTLTTPANFTYSSAPATGLTLINPPDFASAFQANAPLDKVSIFNLMCLPGIVDPTTLAEALAYCEEKRAFFIMDPPGYSVADDQALSLLPAALGTADEIVDIWNGGTIPTSINGALYFPYLQTTDPVTGAPSYAPPSGFVAGIFASEDNNRGVWKSPAGLETVILGTTGVVPWGAMTDPQQGVLNPLGINALRSFPGIGTVVFGARTLAASNTALQQWWYVAVRRMALFIEQSLYASLGWAVFEPNDTPLWNALTQEVQAFMLSLYRQGAFAGATADVAFQVQCDSTTTTQTNIDDGVVNILVGFAPLKPAEFVVVQITQLAGQTQS